MTAWGSVNGDQLCITVGAASGIASGGPAACNALSVLSQPNQLLVLTAGEGTGASASGDATSSPEVVAGLVPNGVSSVTIDFTDGTKMAVPVVDNGFVTTTAGHTPSTYTWTADGATHTE